MSVLDASALLAYLGDEPGADAVEMAIADRATIGAVNLAEVLGSLAVAGHDPEEARVGIRLLAIEVASFDEDLALEAALLRPVTRHAGLSLGDRACLALARRLARPALTADAAWSGAVPDVDVVLIR
jgi:ribonuclease VapC